MEIILGVANRIFPEARQRNITVLHQKFTQWRCNVEVLIVQPAASSIFFCCVMVLETSLTGSMEKCCCITCCGNDTTFTGFPAGLLANHKWVKCKVARSIINLAQFFEDLSRSDGTAPFLLTYRSYYERQRSVSCRELSSLDKTTLESVWCWLRLTARQDGVGGRKISILIGNRH